MKLIPKANGKVIEKAGSFILPEQFSVELGGFSQWCVEAFEQRVGKKLEAGETIVSLKKNADIPSEGYKLSISESGIEVEASCEKGAVYALTTVFELIEDGNKLPLCEITDAPKYSYRALSFDCVRHFFPVEEVKVIIEQISKVKMNAMHWHLSDDQGWRIESKVFPKLTQTSPYFYTQEQIKDIVEFARVRGVEIIPEIDMPGHTTALLAAYPEHSCFRKEVKLAPGGGIYSTVLCPGKEEIFGFIDMLFAEICPLFPSEYFHIGGDEVPKKEWKQCPDCKKRMEEEGIEDFETLQTYFSQRVAKMLEKYGKRPVCWNEALRGERRPENMRVQCWTPMYSKQMLEFAKNGGEFVYSNMFEYYFDYPYSMNTLKKAYTTVPKIKGKKCSKFPGFKGLECCLWAETVAEKNELEYRVFPRAIAVAEAAWSNKLDYNDFQKRLREKAKKLEADGINYGTEDRWNLKGEARKADLQKYFTMFSAPAAATEEEQAEIAVVMDEIKDNVEIEPEFIISFITKFIKLSDVPMFIGLLKDIKK